VFLFFFSVLALLVLDSFLDNFDIAVLTRPARNSVDLLAEKVHLRLALVKCAIGLARDPWEGKTQFREKAKTNWGCALL
jgi:hypothetical protein